MAAEWRKVRIGNLGRVVTGRTPPGNDPTYFGSEVAFLTPSDIADQRRVTVTARSLSPTGAQKLARCLVPQGVGVSCIGWQMGKSVLLDRPTVTNQQINSIIIDSQIADRLFVYYSLRLRRDELFQLGAGGSRTPILNKGDFERLSFTLPPLRDQRAIALILGTLDDKIELNGRLNETLEAMARTLFKSWFLDFDPVRTLTESDSKTRKENIQLFPDTFEVSELGAIPTGWKVITIADLADVVGGSTPSTTEPNYWADAGHYWATPKDLSVLKAPVLLASARCITDAGLSQIGSGLLPVGTVLLSSRAPIGYLAISEVPVAINQGFIAMKPKPGVSNIFLLLWARSSHERIVSRANGSTFLEISKTSFRPIPVVAPPMEIMCKFDRLVRPLYERIVNNARESLTLTTLRDTLLPKLISGDLRVKAAEKMVEAVA